MNKYQKAIVEAKKFLIKHSRDKAHDLVHHEEVWKNCQNLVNSESPKVDLNLLKVATFWHDVILDQVKWPSKLNVEETCSYLSTLLPQIGFTSEETQNVILTVRHHEFRDTPRTVEGLVLQDADKLEAVSIERWNRTLTDYKKKIMTKETLTAYLRTFLKWSPILTATFHYFSSRQIAEKDISPIWIDPQWEKVFKEFDLHSEYLLSKQEKGSLKTLTLRMVIRIKNFLLKITLHSGFLAKITTHS